MSRTLLVACLFGALALVSAAPARADAAPPAELFAELAGLQRRLVYSPRPQTRSGDYQFELVEVDRLEASGVVSHRLVVRCAPLPGATLPPRLVPLGTAYASDPAGRELQLRPGPSFVRAGQDAWLTFYLEGRAAPELMAFSGAVGPPPELERRTVRLELDRLGSPQHADAVGVTTLLGLTRTEGSRLDVAPPGPPYYYALDSTLARATPDPLPGGRYLTLRLFTLAPPESPESWRLANLRLLSTGAPAVEDWRYVRRPWRPDWGGWLGVTGRNRDEGGVEVTALDPASPALAAGVQAGDALVTLDDAPVADAYSLGDAIRTRAAGQVVRLGVLRDGVRRELRVTLGAADLWPDLDPVEFQQAWTTLLPARGRAAGAADVLSQWDWQTNVPLPQVAAPRAVELLYERVAPVTATTFLFRRVPLEPPG